MSENIKVKTRFGPGSGPHAGRIEFYWNNQWHFLKWVSKRDMLKKPKKIKINPEKHLTLG